MSLKIYINGKLLDKNEATISVFDHGLLYGDGVFEGIRSYNGLIFKLTEHLLRLYESAKSIELSIPISLPELTEAIIRTLKANQLKDAYIRLVVTRGVGDLGLDPAKCPSPTIIIITDKIALYPEEYYKNGLELITASTRRSIPEAVNPQIKSLNYLNNILAKIEATNSGVMEAIMLNQNGYLVECSGVNIFVVKKEQVLTPPCFLGALKGITRDAIIELAREEKLEVREEIMTRHDLFNSDESFLTGTAAEIIPVVKVDGRTIGNGKPGKITARLLKKFRQLTKTEGVRY